jgi:carboxypeptidase Q
LEREKNSGFKKNAILFKKLTVMTKYRFLLIVLVLLPSCLIWAQDNSLDTAMISRIRKEGLEDSQIKSIAHHITDLSGPRLTNSPGFHRAAGWIISTLQQWGLSNATLEPWGEFGYGWELEKSYIAMSAPYFSSLIAYPGPWSGSTQGPVTASVVLMDRSDSASLMNNAAQLKGHILLVRNRDEFLRGDLKPDATRYSDSTLVNIQDQYMFNAGMLKMFQPVIKRRNTFRKMARDLGVVAILEMSQGGRDGTVFVDGFGGYRKQDQPAIPQIILSKEDFQRIQRILEDGTEVKLDLDIRARFLGDDLKGHNVVAEIPGTDPQLKDEVVMLGGHLDSWASSTGATDNGAGCIASLEAIRILEAIHVKPRRTIRICLWDGEEEGLYGSFHYVKNHFGDPADMKLKPEQAKISAYYNLDNGSGKIRGIFAQGNEAVVPIFQKWLEPLKDLGATRVTLHNTGSTDHLSFDAVGIPGFQFIQDPLDYETRTHHSNMDNYDHLFLNDLKQAATVIAAFVYNTAMRQDKIPRKPLTAPEKFLFDGLF